MSSGGVSSVVIDQFDELQYTPGTISFSYQGNDVVRIDYPDGSFKTIDYVNDSLVRLTKVSNILTQQRSFNYNAGKLVDVVTVNL